MADVQERAPHDDHGDAAYLTRLLAAGYTSPSIVHNEDGTIKVFFFTTGGKGSYSGDGDDFHSAVRDALRTGATFVADKAVIDAAAEDLV